MINACCQVHDSLQRFGAVLSETVTAVDVDHPTTGATGNIAAVWGDSQRGGSNTALVGEAVDTAAS